MAELLSIASALLVVLVSGLVFLILYSCCSSKPFISSLTNKHVFITGASSGIGLAIAKQALLQGAHVSLISRSAENLEKAVKTLLAETNCSPDSVHCEVADVTNYDQISSAVKGALKWKPIDILACNAGLTRGGFLDAISVEDLDLTVKTNVLGTVYAVHAALPALKKHSLAKNPTSIVITASLASMAVLYGHSVYVATKFAVKGFAEALWFELLPYNIKVSLICPSFTKTAFLDDMDIENQEIHEMMKRLNLYKRAKAASPDDVARMALQGVKKGKFLVTRGDSVGFAVGMMGRGYFNCGESLGKIILEAFCLGSIRMVSYGVTYFYASWLLNWRKKKLLPPHTCMANGPSSKDSSKD